MLVRPDHPELTAECQEITQVDAESLALAPPLEQALRQVTPYNQLLGSGVLWGLPGGVEAVLSSVYPLYHCHWSSRHVGQAVCGECCGGFSLAFCSFTLGETESQERRVRVRHPPIVVSCHAGPWASAEGKPQSVFEEAKFRCLLKRLGGGRPC